VSPCGTRAASVSFRTGAGAGVGLRALPAHARRLQPQDPLRRADRGGRTQDPGYRLRPARPGRGGL